MYLTSAATLACVDRRVGVGALEEDEHALVHAMTMPAGQHFSKQAKVRSSLGRHQIMNDPKRCRTECKDLLLNFCASGKRTIVKRMKTTTQDSTRVSSPSTARRCTGMCSPTRVRSRVCYTGWASARWRRARVRRSAARGVSYGRRCR